MKKGLRFVCALMLIVAIGALATGCGSDKDTPPADPTYTLSYDLDGGTGNVTGGKFAGGGTVTLPTASAVTKTDYTLIGWNDGTVTRDPGALFTMPAKDVTLKAVWQENGQTGETEYALSYDLNGGTGTATGGEYAVGATVELPSASDVTKANHTLTGWNDGTTTHAPGATFTMPANAVTLTAVWQENNVPPVETKYALAYNLNGGTGTATSGEYAAGATVELPLASDVTKANHTLTGWNDGTITHAPGATFTMPAKAVTLTAVWQENAQPPVTKYTVTYKSGAQLVADDVVARNQSGTIKLKSYNAFEEVYAYYEENTYRLLGWKIEGDDTLYIPNANYIVESNVVFVAQWVQCGIVFSNKFEMLMFDSEGNGGLFYIDDTTIVPITYTINGEVLSIVLDGQTFTGKNDNGIMITLTYKSTSYVFSTMTEPQEPIVTFHANGGSGSAPTVTPQASGDNYTIILPQNTFTAPANKKFKCWQIGTNTANTYKVGVKYIANSGEVVNIYAVWEDDTVPEVTGIVFIGRCTTPSKTIMGNTTGGQIYTKFLIDFDNAKLTYSYEGGEDTTTSFTVSSYPQYKPDTYGEDALYYVVTMVRIEYNLLIKADKTKLWLCNNDDKALEGGEFSVQSADSEWEVIDATEYNQLFTNNDGKGCTLYFDPILEYAKNRFVGIQFTYDSSFGDPYRFKVVYKSTGITSVNGEAVTTLNYEKTENNLVYYTSTNYSVAIGKKNGKYYVVTFDYKNNGNPESVPLELHETRPAE